MLTKQTDINFKDATSSRQVITGVVKNFLKLTGITNPDIVYATALSNSNLTQAGSTIGEGREADFGISNKQVLLEVTEKRTEDNKLMRGLGLLEMDLPLFRDDKYNVGMYSNPVEYEVELEIKLRHNSKSKAEAWTSDKMSRIESGLETFVTEGDFHYVIPQTCFKLLEDILNAAKVNDPTEIRTVSEYFEEKLCSPISIMTDQAGKTRTAVATHRVSRVEVILDSGEVIRERDERGSMLGGFVSALNCKFKYTRPETIMLRYPPIINGVIINKDWWYDGTVPGATDGSFSINTPFINASEEIVSSCPYLTLPRYLQEVDYYPPSFTPRDPVELPLVVGYLEYIAPTEAPTLMCNLAELGDLVMTDILLEYIKLCAVDNVTLSSSIISVYIVIDNLQVSKSLVSVMPDLNVWWNGTMELNKIYQLVITINPNLTGCSDDAFDLFRRSPRFLGPFLEDFYPDIYVDKENVLVGELVDASDLMGIVDDATDSDILTGYKSIGFKSSIMVTIMNGRILAH